MLIGSVASALFPTALDPPIAKGDSFDTVVDGAWTYVGNARRDVDDKNVILTDSLVVNQAGVLWLSQEVRTPFNATFRYRAGGGTGGEGFVLMFYKNKGYTPSAGGSLAFGTTSGYGIEFDSLDNGDADPSGNHIALISGNSNNHITYVDDNRTEDNQWHWVEVDVRPFVMVVKVDDIVALEWADTFDTTHGGIGIGASTGTSANYHLVDDIKVRINDTFTENTELWNYGGTSGATAYRDGTNQNVVLTEAQQDRAGRMWLTQDITSPFATTFDYRASGGTGGEGLAFMFYKKMSYTPGTGGSLGFSPDGGTASGYGIEFDSSHGEGDPEGVGNHIALIKDNASNHLAWADSRLWQRMDGGTLNDLHSVWGWSSDNIVAVGQRGTIVCYDGSAWTQIADVTTQDLYGVWGTDDGASVFAVGHNGTILRYSGDWQPVDNVTTEDLYGVWGTSSNDVYAVGGKGTLVHFDGVSWTTIGGLPDEDLRGIWGTSPTDVFAVGQAGTILHFTESSQDQMTSGVTDNLNCVWGTASDDVFAVGTGGRILHYDGSTWSAMTSGSTKDLHGMWGSGPDNVVAVGSEGTVQRYDGSAWSPMESSAADYLHGVWGSAPGDVLAVGSVMLRFDGGELPATISFISPQAEYTPPVIYSRDSRGKLVYLVEARPDPAGAARLKPGQPLEVTAE